VDIFLSGRKIKILDFNVFGSPTSSLLFDWEEDFINSSMIRAEDYIDFRVIEHAGSVRPHEAGRYRGPIDVTLAPDFSSFMQICRQQQQADTDD
jgi:hypothetical protein